MNFQFIHTRQFYLSSNSSSAFKNNGSYNSDIRFNIPNFIKDNDSILYTTIKLSHAQIPYSFYIINNYNNYFRVNNNDIYIENGNYTGTTLINEINKQLISYDPQMNMYLNTVNGKIVLTSNSSFTVDMTKSRIYKILGFESGIYNGIFDGSLSQYKLTSLFPLDLLGTRNVFIKINNVIIDNLNLSTNDKTTLKSIPVNVQPYGIIKYNNTEGTESFISNTNIDYLDVEITDDNNDNINFNGIDWNLCIEIKSLMNGFKFRQSFTDILSKNNIND